LVLINKNNNDFKSRFLEVTAYKDLHIFSLKILQENNNFPLTPCQSLTDPQGSADHSLGNAALIIGLIWLIIDIVNSLSGP